MTRHLQCVEQQESPSNISKDCACQEIPSSRFEPKIRELIPPIERWFEDNPSMIRPWKRHLAPAASETLSMLHGKIQTFRIPAHSQNEMLPLPWTVTLQLHQMLRLPRKIILFTSHMKRPVQCASNRNHFSTSPKSGIFFERQCAGDCQMRLKETDPTLSHYHHAKWISVYPNWETVGSLLFCLRVIPEISASRWWEVWMSEWDSPVCVLSAAWRLFNHLSRVRRRPRRLQKTPFWQIWIWGTTASVMKGPRLGVCSGWGREIYSEYFWEVSTWHWG